MDDRSKGPREPTWWPPPSPLDTDVPGRTDELVEWFAEVTGVEISAPGARPPSPEWIRHGRSGPATWGHEEYPAAWDHPLRATDLAGNRCALIAPYGFGRARADELSAWCDRHRLTWCIVPVNYWHPATVTILVRSITATGVPWWHRTALRAQPGLPAPAGAR